MVFLDKLFRRFPSIINVWISCTSISFTERFYGVYCLGIQVHLLGSKKKGKSSTKGNQPVIFLYVLNTPKYTGDSTLPQKQY